MTRVLFTAHRLQDAKGQEVKMSDYKGKARDPCFPFAAPAVSRAPGCCHLSTSLGRYTRGRSREEPPPQLSSCGPRRL